MFPLNPHLSLNYCRPDFFSSQHPKDHWKKVVQPTIAYYGQACEGAAIETDDAKGRRLVCGLSDFYGQTKSAKLLWVKSLCSRVRVCTLGCNGGNIFVRCQPHDCALARERPKP